MTLEQIKEAVSAGKIVHWLSDGYIVAKDSTGQWFIVCTANDDTVSLTWQDGVTVIGKPEQFYIKE